MAGAGQDFCVICQADIQERRDACRLTACGHVFHSLCLQPWKVVHGTCPQCRGSAACDHGDLRRHRKEVVAQAAETLAEHTKELEKKVQTLEDELLSVRLQRQEEEHMRQVRLMNMILRSGQAFVAMEEHEDAD
jgi:septum formation inhibitor MinC